MTKLGSLCSNPLFHTFSKDVEISRVITFKMILLSSDSTILCVIRHQRWTQNSENPYCLSLSSLFLLRCSTIFLLTIAAKSLLMALRRLSGQYCDGEESSHALLNTGEKILPKATFKQFHQNWRHFRITILENKYRETQRHQESCAP